MTSRRTILAGTAALCLSGGPFQYARSASATEVDSGEGPTSSLEAAAIYADLTPDEQLALNSMGQEAFSIMLKAPTLPGGPVNPRVATDAVIKVAIGAMGLWFRGKGYTLARELLSHSRANSTVDSTYRPDNTPLLRQTGLYRTIQASTATSGSGTFSGGETTREKDAYYAIHKCNWVKSGVGNVVFMDRYDFNGGDYSSWGNAAVATCQVAQSRGIIKPYYVRCVVELA